MFRMYLLSQTQPEHRLLWFVTINTIPLAVASLPTCAQVCTVALSLLVGLILGAVLNFRSSRALAKIGVDHEGEWQGMQRCCVVPLFHIDLAFICFTQFQVLSKPSGENASPSEDPNQVILSLFAPHSIIKRCRAGRTASKGGQAKPRKCYCKKCTCAWSAL
jgi:hypothetical protein